MQCYRSQSGLAHKVPVSSRRSLGNCAALMEDILRWGTQDLFQARKDSEDKQAAGHSGNADMPAATINGEAGLRDSPGNTEPSMQSKVGHNLTSSAGRRPFLS